MRPIADCQQQTSLQLHPCESWTRTHVLLLIILVLVCPVVVITILSAIAIYGWRSRPVPAAPFWQTFRTSSMRAATEFESPSSRQQRNDCRQFTYQELDTATNGFHHSALLGAGATGFVYRGKLDDGARVAVKQLDTRNSGMLINDEFWHEIKVRQSIHFKIEVDLIATRI